MWLLECGCGCARTRTGTLSANPADGAGGGGRTPPGTLPGIADKDRDAVATASRILAAQGVVDAFGHVSMRLPGAPGLFLMSRSLAPALVTAADVVVHDLSGKAAEPAGGSLFIERFIHAEIYRARPDVGAVVHSHSPAVIPFGLVEVPMRAMFHTAAFLAGGVPVFNIEAEFGPTDMLVRDSRKGASLARVLGAHPVALMRGHGSVAVGPSLEAAVFRAVMTEANAKLQAQATALAAGGAIKALSPEEGRLADEVNLKVVARPWELWRRSLAQADGGSFPSAGPGTQADL